MHNVILYGKRNKDHNLLNETPRAKKVLETFIHKIKVLMKKNNCLGALCESRLQFFTNFVLTAVLTRVRRGRALEK